MKTSFSIKSSRVESLTDGIFAIAMTILVFNLTQSNDPIILNLNWHNHLYYKLFVYAGSFIILGTAWVGMVFQYSFLREINRLYLWLNIFFLMGICIVPFSAFLLVQSHRALYDINFYCVNIFFTTFMQWIIWRYAQYRRLNDTTITDGAISHSIYHRIFIALVLYIIALMIAPMNANLAFVLLLIPPIIHFFPGKLDKYLEQ